MSDKTDDTSTTEVTQRRMQLEVVITGDDVSFKLTTPVWRMAGHYAFGQPETEAAQLIDALVLKVGGRSMLP